MLNGVYAPAVLCYAERMGLCTNEKESFEKVINASSLKLTDKLSGHCLIEINLLEKNIMQIPHGKFYTHYGQLVEVTSSLYRIEGVEVKNNIIDACGKAFVVV